MTRSTTAPDHAHVLQGLAEVLDEVAGTPAADVVPGATFEQLEVDSLTMVEVVVACEERFGVTIGDEALEGLRTVGDAVDLVQRLAGSA